MGLLPRLLAFLAIAYALSPLDLIPDFIPVLGLLDDLIILPGQPSGQQPGVLCVLPGRCMLPCLHACMLLAVTVAGCAMAFCCSQTYPPIPSLTMSPFS